MMAQKQATVWKVTPVPGRVEMYKSDLLENGVAQ